MLLIKVSHKLSKFKEYFTSPTKAISHPIDIFAIFSGKALTLSSKEPFLMLL